MSKKRASNINYPANESNLPGLNRVRLIAASDVLKIVYGTKREVVAGGIYLKDAPLVILLPITEGELVETDGWTPHGKFVHSSVSFFVPSDSAVSRDIFDLINTEKWLIVCLDNSGRTRLVGTKEQPCLHEGKFGTDGWQGRRLVFQTRTKLGSRFLSGWQDEEIFAEFSEEFSLDFTA